MLTAFWLLLSALTGHLTSHSIPAGSMKPTLLIGDVVLSAPIRSMPDRGDLVIFTHSVQGTDWIKRVIAVEGDTVQMRDGVVILNGEPLARTAIEDFVETYQRQGPYDAFPRCETQLTEVGAPCSKQQHVETFPDGKSIFVLEILVAALDDTEIFEVPAGHVFVMGDNRDNSTDSRVKQAHGGVGMVPVEALLSKPFMILYSSTARNQTWNPATWREGRFLVPVQ